MDRKCPQCGLPWKKVAYLIPGTEIKDAGPEDTWLYVRTDCDCQSTLFANLDWPYRGRVSFDRLVADGFEVIS